MTFRPQPKTLQPDAASQRSAQRAAHWRPALLAVLLILGAGCGVRTPPPPVTPPTVDGANALRLATAVAALGPRPAGSAGAARAAAWLADRCRDAGYTPEIDHWTEAPAGTPLNFRSVVARLPGRAPGRILLASHFDTKVLAEAPGFTGANDSASSTGLLLELMRAFAALQPAWSGPTLEFAFFDGEECLERYSERDGLRGSTHWADRIRRRNGAADYRAMILLDMVGDRDLKLTLPADTPPDLARRLLRLAEKRGWEKQVGFYAGNLLDDHTPFQELGIPAVDLIDFDYGPENAWWHTAEDTVDKLSATSLAIAGQLAADLAADLASRPVDKGGN